MHSAPLRFAIGAAFLALVALGAALAGLEPSAIVALVAVALVLAALVDRAYARKAGRARVDSPAAPQAPAEEPAPPEHVEAVDFDPAPEPESAPEPPPEPVLAVSERSARAILASGPPPVQEPPPRKSEPKPETLPEPVTEPEPEPEPVSTALRREWNLWELQRLVRERPDDERHDEWAAMLVSLREYARADGTLPLEFDELVRESFGALLEPASTEAVAAS